MRNLTPEELDRLLRARRRTLVAALVAIVIVVGAVIAMIAADFPVVLGGGVGILIGLILVVPYRRVLSDLGLSTADATAILEAERDRRTGVAALSPRERAARETVRSRAFLAAGLVLVVAFCVAGTYFAENMGKTVDEDAPDNPWFGVSAITAAVTLCLAPALLWMAALRRSAAKQMMADDAGADR